MERLNAFFPQIELEQLWNLINQAKTFALLGHKDPDRDTIFSCLAMAEVLGRLGKKVEIIFPEKPNFKIKSEYGIILYGKHSFVPEVLMFFDIACPDRAYGPKAFETVEQIINIDHHISNSVPGKLNFVDPNASSACEVLARILFNVCKEAVVPTVAQNLLIGLLDDSIIFKTSQSSASSLETALKLIESGADFAKAKKIVSGHRSVDQVKNWARLISIGQHNHKKSLFLISVDQTMGFEISSLEGLVNFISGIIDCDIIALLIEIPFTGEIKGSLRSKYSDVCALAQKFGGGGHKCAAGFRAKGTLSAITQELLEAI